MTGLKKRLSVLAGATLVTMSLGDAVAYAQNTSGGPGPFGGRAGVGRHHRFGGPGGLAPMLGRLNLSDAQREQVKSIRDSHRDEMKAAADKAFAARNALRSAVASEQFDESTVRGRSADVAAAEADLAVLNARIYSEVWQILTPEQQKAAKAAQARRQERAANGRGRAGGNGRSVR